MAKSRPLASNTRQAAPTNWRSKSSPEAFETELRDPASTQEGNSETKSHTVPLSQEGKTIIPPKTFQDILPPELITTSTLSEAGYIGYRKSKFKTTRSSTLPPPPLSQSIVLDQAPTEGSDYPLATTTRRSTLKRVMQSLKRSISTRNGSKKTARLPIPSSNAFPPKSSRSRFGTGPGRQTFGRQDDGYLNLSDGEAEESKN